MTSLIQEWDYEAAKVYLKKEAKKLGLQKMAKLGKIIKKVFYSVLINNKL